MELNEIGDFVEGVWLPKGEKHLRHWMTMDKNAFRLKGKITYQWAKQKRAMEIGDEYMPEWRKKVFVDVGAHCGFWSMWWGRQGIPGIVAYEPIQQFRELYQINVRANEVPILISMMEMALGEVDGELEIRLDPANTGGTRAYADGEHHDFPIVTAPIRTLDGTLPAELKDHGAPMGVLKIDCEGLEERVVKGALECIEEDQPLIIVEQKFETKHFGYKRNGAVELLQGLGYATVKVMSGDHIMIPRDRRP